jgi:serine/threonine protein kinase
MVRKKDNGSIMAMKILDKDKLKKTNQLEHIKTERIVLEHIEHPFLVRLHYAFQTNEKLYMRFFFFYFSIVMDFVNGGELFFHMKKEKRFKESRAKFYSAEIFLSLSHLHKNGIVYRDLKPESIFFFVFIYRYT